MYGAFGVPIPRLLALAVTVAAVANSLAVVFVRRIQSLTSIYAFAGVLATSLLLVAVALVEVGWVPT